MRTSFEDVRVDHGGGDVGVTEHLLDRADVATGFEREGGQIFGSEIGGVTSPVKASKAANPVLVGALSARAVVLLPQPRTELLDERRTAARGRAGWHHTTTCAARSELRRNLGSR